MQKLSLLIVTVMTLLGMIATPTRASMPSIVFILLDDLGYGDLGAYGGSFISTPRIDQLASEGMRFKQYYVNAPVCSPTRVALLTGRYPAEFGLRRIIPLTSSRGIPEDVVTLAESLRAAGYATGHFGKWHVGSSRPAFLPTGQGFERSVVRHGAGPPSYLDPMLSFDDAVEIQASGHLTELTTDHAIAFVEQHAGEPFFLNLWYNAPHAPWEPPAEWAARYPAGSDGEYAALVSHVDAEIGRLLDRLAELGIDENTLVLLSSDNGAVIKGIPSNGSLRGGKQSVLEGGIRVPMIVRWPGRVAAGATNDSVFVSFDVYPTLMDLLGLDASGLELAGRSLREALLGGSRVERAEPIFWENKAATRYTLSADGEWNVAAVRSGRWKLRRVRDRVVELYDVETDPGELVDLAASEWPIANRLLAEYRAWRSRVARLRTRRRADPHSAARPAARPSRTPTCRAWETPASHAG